MSELRLPTVKVIYLDQWLQKAIASDDVVSFANVLHIRKTQRQKVEFIEHSLIVKKDKTLGRPITMLADPTLAKVYYGAGDSTETNLALFLANECKHVPLPVSRPVSNCPESSPMDENGLILIFDFINLQKFDIIRPGKELRDKVRQACDALLDATCKEDSSEAAYHRQIYTEAMQLLATLATF